MSWMAILADEHLKEKLEEFLKNNPQWRKQDYDEQRQHPPQENQSSPAE